MRLPRVFFSVDGLEVFLDSWSASATADLGFDQFRALASNVRARKVVGGIAQGSVLRVMTETGRTIWEGTISAPPELRQDGVAQVAAQGYGYHAAKAGNRITPILDQPGAWIPAYLPPVSYPSGGFFSEPVVANTLTTRSITFTPDGLSSEVGFAFYARKMNITRIQVTATGGPWKVITGKLPNVAKNYRVHRVFSSSTIQDFLGLGSSGSGFGRRRDLSSTFEPSDVVILTVYNNAGAVGSSQKVISNPKLWGDYDSDAIYSDLAARIVARQLGWDESGVTGVGIAPMTTSDWVGDAVAYLGRIASAEDFCWGVYEDRGYGPFLRFGPYGERTWEVSAATGATWDLDPLERVRRVTIQYLNVDNSLAEATVEADDAAQLPASVDTELKGSLADNQSSGILAMISATKTLRRFLEARFRGQVLFTRAFESGSRREAPYEVRPGDVVKIVDFSLDGAISLRVADVSYGPGGISVGVEAPSLGLGGPLSGRPGGAAPGQQATLVTNTTGGAAVYVPPGIGTPVPGGGIGGGILKDVTVKPPGGGF